ncbi:hypothetical protein [Flavobacterium sp. CSZ]|uniref:hypothetical protein n=1 Tax=Flavobacterium sp. CSZ TaxID=2783791 RepID=UPI001889F443|nr:hypothetical protein [Flavobacterium sp. CSZ]MBF4484427.1 hypothetical protein [Flavobacterium sp. CSZ]
MSNKNNNATAEAAVALQQDYDTKLEVLNGLPEVATAEEKQSAQTAVDDAKVLLDAELSKSKAPVTKAGTDKVKAEKAKLVKGKFLLSPTGRFGLAYNAGELAELEEKQAKELDEAGYFKIGG